MKKWLKQNKKSIFIFGFFILIGFPVIIYLLSTLPFFPVGGNNDWAGFWGGYLGAIVGGAITLYVLFVTLEDNKNIQLRNEKIEFLNNLVDITAEYTCIAEIFIQNIEAYIESDNRDIETTHNNRKQLMATYIELKKIGIRVEIQLDLCKAKGSYKNVDSLLNYVKENNELANNTYYVVINNIGDSSYDSLFEYIEKVATTICIEKTNNNIEVFNKQLSKFQDNIKEFIFLNIDQ